MKPINPNPDISIRTGTVDDLPVLMSLIRAMSKSEKRKASAAEASLRETLFGEHPSAWVFLAYVNEEPVGYAVYFFSFTIMLGKRGLWLDDLYVRPGFRDRGVAAALLAHLTEIAIQNNCGRFEWMTLHWNKPAADFYLNLKAAVLEQWRLFRIQIG